MLEQVVRNKFIMFVGMQPSSTASPPRRETPVAAFDRAFRNAILVPKEEGGEEGMNNEYIRRETYRAMVACLLLLLGCCCEVLKVKNNEIQTFKQEALAKTNF